jgi:hypothetical protein
MGNRWLHDAHIICCVLRLDEMTPTILYLPTSIQSHNTNLQMQKELRRKSSRKNLAILLTTIVLFLSLYKRDTQRVIFNFVCHVLTLAPGKKLRLMLSRIVLDLSGNTLVRPIRVNMNCLVAASKRWSWIDCLVCCCCCCLLLKVPLVPLRLLFFPNKTVDDSNGVEAT